jgi:hypothetical protein
MSARYPDPHSEDPLPPGWSREYSKSQKRNFYFHKETKHVQWHFPTATEAKDPSKAMERAEANKERDRKRAAEDPLEKKETSTVEGSSSNNNSTKRRTATTKMSGSDDIFSDSLLDATSVAIIVPYRDLHAAQKRAAHLQNFVPHMVQFLGQLKKDGLVSGFHIYIVEQSTKDGRKFNRGKLLNIGFDLARKSGRAHDVYIFHDVDLLPQADLAIWYARFPKQPIHIARVWDRYSNNPKYFGGVVSFSSSDYKRINGVSLRACVRVTASRGVVWICCSPAALSRKGPIFNVVSHAPIISAPIRMYVYIFDV